MKFISRYFSQLHQEGNSQILLLLAALGIISFLAVSSALPFKDKLNALLYPKPTSKAVADINAATMALNTTTTTVAPGQQISVSLTTRSDTHKANLFSAKINFDPTKVEVVGIDTTGTFITQWVEKIYDNTTGKISIVGGVPKPGFSTSGADVAIATITLSAKAEGITPIAFDATSAVYRNNDNVNFLGGTTNLTLTIQAPPTPTPTEAPLPTPTPTGAPTPTPTIPVVPTDTPTPTPTPIACSIQNAFWNTTTNPVDEGAITTLIVQGFGDCFGKQVALEVWEDDGLLGSDPATNNPATASFSMDNSASSSWIAEYQPDGFNGVNDPPEYYFNASLVGGTSTLKSSDPMLLVNKSTSTTFKKGDANRNGVVDLQDLSILFSYWFDTSGFPDEVDINNDGVINTFDFSGMIVILKQEGILSSTP